MNITLPPDWLDYATAMGRSRYRHFVNLPQRAYYAGRRRSELVDTYAAVGECAVALHTRQRWNAALPSDDPTLPDVGDRIEVRNLLRPGNPFVVRRHEAERGAEMWWVYVAPDYTVEVLGIADATEAWTNGAPYLRDPHRSRVVPDGLVETVEDREWRRILDVTQYGYPATEWGYV